MARIAWTFYDPVEATTYEWPVNPNDGGSPSVIKKFDNMSVTAQDGAPIFYQGVNEPQKIEVSGIILSQSQYDTLVTWAGYNRLILLTDDLGREFQVLIESFRPKRERRAKNTYYHTYNMTLVVMG